MAEGESLNLEPNISDDSQNRITAKAQPELKVPSSTHTRRKLGQTASKTWINKSFDQSTLSQCGTNVHKPIKRQSSVSDFFQSMLTKSRSHLFSLFSGAKKENRRQSMLDISDRSSPSLDAISNHDLLKENNSPGSQSPHSRTEYLSRPNSSPNSPHCLDKPSKGGDKYKRDASTPRQYQLDTSSLKDVNCSKDRISPVDMFIVTKSIVPPQKAVVENKNPSTFHTSCQSLVSDGDERNSVEGQEENSNSLVGPCLRREFTSTSLYENCNTTLITSSVENFSCKDDSNEEIEKQDSSRYRLISSAPVGRQSLSIESTAFLTADYGRQVMNTKRALVKSNSDTITKFSSALTPIVKASSDGNCFTKSLSKTSIAVSTSSTVDHVLNRITDYLFLGSVEAAYSEPLLCKYKISSLIDMTNINPRVVPLQKKTDCPCACVTKNHFRSRLNIGVDDIEWENLEQYFKEINAFINGARKKRGRTLVFSYMGKSRAPAAVIQHLMHHYEMSYREAFNIVVSKRPQTKINPGFIKALKRLEKNLALEKGENRTRKQLSPSISPIKKSLDDEAARIGGVEEGIRERKDGSCSEYVPPVVRGAWLEC